MYCMVRFFVVSLHADKTITLWALRITKKKRNSFLIFSTMGKRILLFADKADEELCASIRKQNVLIIDDVTTSGSTLNEILRTLRILNADNDITIFSLIGRKDLMAEAF